MPHPTTVARRNMKANDPDRYQEYLSKRREAQQRYRDVEKKKWEEETHTKAQMEERERKIKEKRARERERYRCKKAEENCQTRRSSTIQAPGPLAKKLRDMSPDELRHYKTNQRKRQRDNLSVQKKNAIKKRRREQYRKRRDAEVLAFNSSSEGCTPSSSRLSVRQSLYNLNYKGKQANMKTRGVFKRTMASDNEGRETVGKKTLIEDSTRLTEVISSNDILAVEEILERKDVKLSSLTLNAAFLSAVENGRRQIVQLLLNHGVCVDETDTIGCSALLAAVKHGFLDIVKMLVKKGAPVNSKDSDGKTALMIAVEKSCCSALVSYLLDECRTNVYLQDNAGKTVLMLAVEQWDYETVRKLITSHNCSESVRDKKGHTALSLAQRNGFIGLLKLLRQSNCREVSPINLAVESNDVNLVRQLLEISPSCLKAGTCEDSPLTTAMHGLDLEWDGKIHCSSEIMELLLQRGVALDNHHWCCDYTALMFAARAGSETVVQLLIRYGADLNKSRLNGQNALTMAAYKGNAEVVEILIKAGADLYVKDKRGEDVLSFAVMSGDKECIVTVLKHWRRLKRCDIESLEDSKVLHVLLDVKDKWRQLLKEPQVTQILCKAIKAKSYQFVTALIDYGANINGWCFSSCPLFLALDDTSLLCLILEKGAKVNNRETSTSFTALMKAAIDGNKEIVEILLKHNADMYAESNGSTALTLASSHNKTEVVDALLDHGMNVNHVTQTNKTALSCAVIAKNISLKEMLIKRGATCIAYHKISA